MTSLQPVLVCNMLNMETHRKLCLPQGRKKMTRKNFKDNIFSKQLHTVGRFFFLISHAIKLLVLFDLPTKTYCFVSSAWCPVSSSSQTPVSVEIGARSDSDDAIIFLIFLACGNSLYTPHYIWVIMPPYLLHVSHSFSIKQHTAQPQSPQLCSSLKQQLVVMSCYYVMIMI